MAEHLPDQAHGVDVHLAEGLWGFALGGKHAPGFEDAAAVFKEGAVEQAFSRSGGIGAIHEHHVVGGIGGGGGPGDAVAHGEMEAGIVPAATANRGQVLLAPLHHQAVDFDHVEVLDPWVLEALAGGAAVAPADHEHPAKALGAAEGGVDDGFVVVPFLALGGHPAAIQQQPFAVADAVDDRHRLEGGVLFGDHRALEAVAHAIEGFIDPAHRPWGRSLQLSASGV